MDRPINVGKNLAQGLMQMEARPVTSGVNMRTRSMGRAENLRARSASASKYVMMYPSRLN